jgi:hypothetical protein
MLKFQLQGSALTVTGNHAYGYERQKEGGRQFAGTERRRPDSNQWRECLANAG